MLHAMLTPHFSLDEFVHSETAARAGIDNTPSPEIIENLRFLAGCLEDVRALLRKPIIITSGYRCPEINRRVGGAAGSLHMKGQAADIIAPAFGTPLRVCEAIARSGLRFDQVIYEYGWCHVSFTREPRGSVISLRADRKGYSFGLPPEETT